MSKNGITLLEVLIVVVIMGILAAMGVPTFTRRIERTRGERAITNIELIVDAYKMQLIRDPNTPFDMANLIAINTAYNLELVDNSFDYNTNIVDDPDPSVRYFFVRAARHGTGETIIYQVFGNGNEQWDPNSTWPWMPQN